MIIFGFLVIGVSLGLTVNVKSDIVNMTILEEGFESGIPTEWSNSGWLDSHYGSSHNGTGWAYSWAQGDTLTTTTLNFGNNTRLSFWHASEVGSPMSIEVYIDDTSTSNLLWSNYNFTYTEYNKIIIDLGNYSGYHQIIFVGKTTGFNGQLLDDIFITSYLEEDLLMMGDQEMVKEVVYRQLKIHLLLQIFQRANHIKVIRMDQFYLMHH